MDFSKIVCPACRKPVKEPINLLCDHNLCFKCAEKILQLESETEYQKKYKVVCPSCRKLTVTYDLRHLIISLTEYNEDLYVTSKYISHKPEIKVSSSQYNSVDSHKLSRKSNPDLHQSSPRVKILRKNPSNLDNQRDNSKNRASLNSTLGGPRNSRNLLDHHSISNNNMSCFFEESASPVCNVKCSTHYNSYRFYCQGDKSLLCQECLKWHKGHRIQELRSCLDVVAENNNKLKDQTRHRVHDLKVILNQATEFKKALNNEYTAMVASLDSEFKAVHELVEKKHEELASSLKTIYLMKLEENSIYLNDIGDTLKCLAELSELPLKDSDSHVYFYSLFSSNRKLLASQIQSPKLVSYCWDKNDAILREGLEKILKLKQKPSPQTTNTVAFSLAHGNQPIKASDHQRKKSAHNCSYMEILSANVSRKGSICEQVLKQAPVSGKGTNKQNQRPGSIQLDLKRVKF